MPVSAENWKDHAVGAIGNEVLRDGEFIRVPITLMDAETVRQVQSGKCQLSMGYGLGMNFESGVTPDGEAYDCLMRGLKMNHMAIVDRGRAGPEVRIGDSWGASPIY